MMAHQQQKTQVSPETDLEKAAGAIVDMCRASRLGVPQERLNYNFDHSRDQCIKAVVAALSASPHIGVRATRETIARIIDPKSFEDRERYAAQPIFVSPEAAQSAADYQYGEHIKRAYAKADAILSLPAQADQWQDISTAPKDGTWFLGCESGIGINTKFDRREVMSWRRSRNGSLGWHSSADGRCEPIAWQPLPAPPSTSQQSEGK